MTSHASDLQSRIQAVIEEYEDDFQPLTFVDDDDPEHAAELTRSFQALAAWFLDAAWDLSAEFGEAVRILRTLRRNGQIEEELRERLEIKMAWEFYGVGTMAARSLELIDVMLEHRESMAVLKYLRRVARCYIAGLDPECIVMCRAVIENSLRQRAIREDCPFGEDSSLEGRINFAASLADWLTAKGARAAHTVRLRGNKVIHDDPEIVGAALETIQLAMIVARELGSDLGTA